MGKTKAKVDADKKKKAKLVEELAALGVTEIEVDGKKVDVSTLGTADLEKQVKAAKKAAVDAKKGALGGIGKNVKEVQVVDGNGDFIRTYSKGVHGEDFLEKAAEFASKKEGRKVEEIDE